MVLPIRVWSVSKISLTHMCVPHFVRRWDYQYELLLRISLTISYNQLLHQQKNKDKKSGKILGRRRRRLQEVQQARCNVKQLILKEDVDGKTCFIHIV
mmetsp:Transcript_9652/g.10392  ORF Transcript_9652/g.10392 Transcript_9652/m.10392 type:complete len:98 (-) Transcript_9652:33-326(-)